MKFALTNKEHLAQDAKATTRTHLECGEPLVSIGDNKYYCAKCIKSGYPIKISK